jgi:hypothetical protein
MMNAILWILVIIFGIILFFLLSIFVVSVIPVKYTGKINTNGKINFYFEAKYFFRFLRFVYVYKEGAGRAAFFVAGIRTGAKKQVSKQKVAKTIAKKTVQIKKTATETKAKSAKKQACRPEEKPTSYLKNLYAVLTDSQGKTIIKLVLVTIKKILLVLRPKYFDISGVVGFSDPSQTGMFFGAYEAVAGIFRIRDNVRLWGDFNTETTVIKTRGEVRGSVSIFRLMLPVASLVLKKPVRKLIKDVLRKDDTQ